jgi:hypothetical protein
MKNLRISQSKILPTINAETDMHSAQYNKQPIISESWMKGLKEHGQILTNASDNQSSNKASISQLQAQPELHLQETKANINYINRLQGETTYN